jgi:hypothetical protein
MASGQTSRTEIDPAAEKVTARREAFNLPPHYVNFIFHGLFGFLVDQRGGTIKVAAPYVSDHTYAVRVATPLGAPSPQAWPTFYVKLHGLAVAFDRSYVSTNGGFDRTNILLAPEIFPPADDRSLVGQLPMNPFMNFQIPCPDVARFYRLSPEVIAFSGSDAPIDAKQPKRYAIVHRYIYYVDPAKVHVFVKTDSGPTNILPFGYPSLNVHFYAEPLCSDMHDPAHAFANLPPIYGPQPDIQMVGDLQGEADPPREEEGLSVADEQDLGEYLGRCSPPTPLHNAKLRNCLSATFLVG